MNTFGLIINYLRKGRLFSVSPNTVLLPNDILLLSIRSNIQHLYFQEWLKDEQLVVNIISPIGTIVDSLDIDLKYTGLEEFYSFEISNNLYSGVYILSIQGKNTEIKRKITIKTNRKLVNHYILTYGAKITNTSEENLTGFIADIVIPPNIGQFQEVQKIKFNINPVEKKCDIDGNCWARFHFPIVYPNEDIILEYKALVTTKIIGYDVTRIKTIRELEEVNYEFFERYTRNEPFIESDDILIKKVTRSLKSENPIDKAINILNYIQKNINYQHELGDFGAKYAIRAKRGDCTEFASLFVGMCRAAKIPARLATSLIKEDGLRWEKHSYAEFFAKGIWWQIDPTLNTDKQYLTRNPENIVLLRGNSLAKTHIKEIRYFHSDLKRKKVNVQIYWKVEEVKTFSQNNEKRGHVWDNQNNSNTRLNTQRKDIVQDANKSFISINVPTLPEVSTGSIYKVPVRLINNSTSEVSGTLVVSINRGGIFISQLYQRTIKAKSNTGIVVDIPAQSYFGPAMIEFSFQDNTGFVFCKSEKKIQFQ
ncbi:MAG: transglutaminase-like domain-containing protein [Candidatus Heimdallarchaeum aukensis]|uniref:Transglutaminase-like domain-containing protein n=1 Tax=Candidatus Heimdallarchaeum aukensis TaxID=2876573 RepID=A0A9Y1BPD9_9ARCH|nr:MAG: transglutaminase-like domain-containing protein [Candidatus Heimdallarchaeum aukensis]